MSESELEKRIRKLEIADAGRAVTIENIGTDMGELKARVRGIDTRVWGILAALVVNIILILGGAHV